MISRREAFYNALKLRGFKDVPTRQRVDFSKGCGVSYAHKMVGTIEYQGMTDEVTYWISNDGHLRVGRNIKSCKGVVDEVVVELLTLGGYNAEYDLQSIEDDIEGLQTDPDADPMWVQHELSVAEYDRMIARRVLSGE